MSYALKYLPTGQYFHFSGGIDRFNLGINPKLYKDIHAAERDKLFVPQMIKRQLEICSNSFIGLVEKGKPKWYDRRDKMKLNKSQLNKLEWYENALKGVRDRSKFAENLKITDIIVVPFPEE